MEAKGSIHELEFADAVERLEASDTPQESNRYAQLLRVCGRLRALSLGRRIHAHIARCGRSSSTFLSNLLIQMYGRCGDLELARAVFDSIRERNLFSWAILMTAYALNQHDRAALKLFREMDQEGMRAESATFVSLVGACAGIGDLSEARKLYERILATELETIWVADTAESDLVLATALVNMFGKCQGVEYAREVFDGIRNKNQVTWNAMLSAYTHNGYNREALDLYRRMEREGIRPDESTFPSVLAACSSLEDGEVIYQRIRNCCLECDLVVGTSLVSMYGSFGALEQAMDVFRMMKHRNTVTWCAMITAYVQNGHPRPALELFGEMLRARVCPNYVTYLSVLEACAMLGDLGLGRDIHVNVVAAGLEKHVSVANALINMYGKCGSLIDARTVFNESNNRDLISWNSMIEAYAQLGHAADCVKMFQEMRLDGTKPDQVTFLEIIFACSHAGKLSHGLYYFCSMVEDECLKPSDEHYQCMVDLLGRAGDLNKAGSLVQDLQCKLNSVAWTTLMGACIVHGNTNEGAGIAERVVEQQPVGHAPYVLLSNMYSK